MRALRWAGTLTATAAVTLAFTPVDDCGTLVRPDSTRTALPCDVPLADRWDAVWLLGTIGVVLLVVWQIINWRQSKRA